MALSKPTWMQNEDYEAQADRGLIGAMWDEGVVRRGGLRVTQRDAGTNMSVDVTGDTPMFIEGDDQPNQGIYHMRFTGTENLPVVAAPGTNSRIDLVVVRVNDEQAGGVATNDGTLEVLTGTPAASPSAPTVPDTAIPLFSIGPITPATAAITNAMLTDLRPLAGRVATPGTIEMLAGGIVPTGWLKCDGSAVSRSTYADLFAEVGIIYGAGDGSATFNLPNMVERLPLATSSSNSAGQTGGSATSSIGVSNLPEHDHSNNHQHAPHDHDAFINGGVGTEGGDSGIQVPRSNLTTYQVEDDTPESYVGRTGDTGDGIPISIMQPYQRIGLAVIRT